MLDLSSEIESLWDELQEAVARVMRSGQFILGPEVTAFENEAAAYLGVKHAIGCNSGTDALVIGLRAIGIEAGDEVIVPSFSFFATAEAVTIVGGTPVFVDIEPKTFNLDPALIEAAITEKTKAIIPVHLFGQAVDMTPVLAIAKKHNLRIIEDTAQAFGGKYISGNQQTMVGTLGDLGSYSFFPSKNLGTYGDGGLITTNDDELAQQSRMLRAHGSEKRYHNVMIGYNSRLDAMQAAILRVKLPHVDTWNNQRRDAAMRYDTLLANTEHVTPPPRADHAHHVYHQYTVRVAAGHRDDLNKKLADRGVSSMIYYPIPIHRQKPYENMGVTLPHTDQACEQVLSLPIGPALDEATQQTIVDAMR